MRRRNRQLLAERLGWPAGAVDACDRLERDFPAWSFYWCSMRRAYAAASRSSGLAHHVLYREDPAEIRKIVGTVPQLSWRSSWTPPERRAVTAQPPGRTTPSS